MTAVHPDQFLNRAAVAAILGISPRTLDRWRTAGSGPPYYEFGNRVRYRWREVQAWADACRERRVSGVSWHAARNG